MAIGDINNDGLADIFFTSNQGAINYILTKAILSLKIFLIKPGSGKKKWNTGVVFADINNDGWLDIYVCNSGAWMIHH